MWAGWLADQTGLWPLGACQPRPALATHQPEDRPLSDAVPGPWSPWSRQADLEAADLTPRDQMAVLNAARPGRVTRSLEAVSTGN